MVQQCSPRRQRPPWPVRTKKRREARAEAKRLVAEREEQRAKSEPAERKNREVAEQLAAETERKVGRSRGEAGQDGRAGGAGGTLCGSAVARV